ncbi:unnamed protein product [Rotaria socialis]|uniref:RanBD1 domain-containing protein n=1 Tax=Rotaria socialis TaxID=392032 RepID=A0A820M863_9BILA|nr:unnamed protein product [Rotaria socialis]CAF4369525.1 unnamed protein product [Rotaria socialis]
MSAQLPEITFDEYLNEQLINSLNLQTNVIQNLAQYSRHISFQLVDIKNDVEILANRVIALQQQQQSQFLPPLQMFVQPSIPPSNSLCFFPPAMQVFPPLHKPFFSTTPDIPTKPVPFSFSTIEPEPLSLNAPFVFGPISSNDITTLYDEAEDTNDPYGPSVSFKPIVHLSPVRVRTGEEDEHVLFCERAKLYRFDFSSNEMKERGIGEMKILQHKTTKQCRILMRRDQVFKVCANHKITSQMELQPHRETANTLIWSAMDFSDGQFKHETLCIKFKTNEQAVNFSKIFHQAKLINLNDTDDLPSIKDISLNDDDIITIGELKPTAEQIERAKILQLPLTFYLYENKQPCKGCRGCREDSSWILPNESFHGNRLNSYDGATTLAFDNMSNFPSGFFPNSSPSSLISMVPTWIPTGADTYSSSSSSFNISSLPKDQRTIIKAKRCLPSNRVPPPPSPPQSYSEHQQTSIGVDEPTAARTNQKKTRNFSSSTREPFSLDSYASQMAQTIIDQVKQELYKIMTEDQVLKTNNDKTTTVHDDNKPSTFSAINSSSIQSINKSVPPINIDLIFGSLASIKPLNSGFPFPNFDKAKIPSTDFSQSIPSPLITTDSAPLLMFGTMPKLSFSDIAQQASNFNLTNDDKPRVFPGQGFRLFGHDLTNNDEDEVDSYEPTLSFKPIVHLSPVEVRTGEEDEHVLFCERAKLYRFDSSSNEMKERGIGEMKILQHKTTNQCRVLMRRDQVFKVCANHKIMPQMELKDHQSKENAYIWSALDYSDGQPKRETLCVRFKTVDQAKRFFQQFNDAKQINSNIQQ